MSVRLAIDQFTTPLEDTPSFKTTTESEILDILLYIGIDKADENPEFRTEGSGFG